MLNLKIKLIYGPRYVLISLPQLAKWWDDYAYLANREPHNPYVNFAGPSPYVLSYWPPEDGVQIKRAGLALWSGMKYWQAVFQ